MLRIFLEAFGTEFPDFLFLRDSLDPQSFGHLLVIHGCFIFFET